MSSLKGKVALITGGSKGIGRAISLALAKEGALVVINYSSDSKSADQLVEEIGAEQALAVEADAGSIDGAELMVKATIDRFGTLDILVPSAGTLEDRCVLGGVIADDLLGTSPMKDLSSTTEKDFDVALRLNVKGPYFIAQKAAAVMTSGSSIVFISSSLCHFSGVVPEDLLYCCCKGMVEQLTQVLSKDLARRQVSVNAVAPGPVDGEHFRKGKSQELIDTITHTVPKGRLGTAEEIADVVAFLCSDRAQWVTGQVIKVNGGMD